MIARNLFISLFFALVAISPISAQESADLRKEFNSAYREYQNNAASKNWDDALPLAKEALRLGKIVFDSSSKSLPALQHNLAKTYKGLKKWDAAKEQMQVALTEYENVYGADAEELIEPLFEMGEMHATNFKMTKQEYFYDRALEIAEKSYGLSSYEYPYYVSQAGVNILVLSHRSTAKLYLKKAHRIMAENFGENSNEMAFPKINLAKYYMSIHRKKKAIELLDSVVAILDTENTRSSPFNLTAHGILAQIHTDYGNDDKATEHCLAIGQLRSKLPEQEPYLIVKKRPKFPNVVGTTGGWVRVSFDVDESGFVVNPKVQASAAQKSFEKASLEAVSRYRYAPAFKDGVAVETLGLVQSFSYGYVGPGRY